MTLFISRRESDAKEFYRDLRAAEISVSGCNLISIEPTIGADEVADAVGASPMDYLIFTSGRAVHIFSDLWDPGSESREMTVLCSGGRSLEAATKCAFPNIVPTTVAGQEGVIAFFAERGLDLGCRIVIPCSQRASPRLATWLQEHGADVVQLPIYRPGTCRSEQTREVILSLRSLQTDAFAFTSPSSVEAFLELSQKTDLKQYLEKSTRLAIGSTTGAALVNLTGGVEHVADEPTLDGLARLVLRIAGRI